MSTTPHSDCREQYDRDGYCVVASLLADDEVSLLCRRAEHIANGLIPTFPRADIELEPNADGVQHAGTVRKLNNLVANDEVFREHALNARILDVVESLLGPNIRIYGSQLFMKPPGGIEKPWHQDSAYFPIEPMQLVTCWTALDDVTIENGCMWVLPGSHRDGILSHDLEWSLGTRIDKQINATAVAVATEVPVTLSRGSCSFHHSVLVHRSGPNNTNCPRRGLAVHYLSGDSRWCDESRPAPEFLWARGR